MTEAEAKTKWCPFSHSLVQARGRSGDVSVTSANRSDLGVHAVGPCLASGCMAWRVNRDAGKAGQGFCGLAGRSE